MGAKDPAFPGIADTTVGLTKREWFVGQIVNGYLAAGATEIPSLKDMIDLADKLIKKCHEVKE